MSQYVVSKSKFYGSTRPILDDIIIDINETDENIDPVEYLPVWLAKYLVFVCVCNPIRTSSFDTELLFVQFYDVLSDAALNIDEVDPSLS